MKRSEILKIIGDVIWEYNEEWPSIQSKHILEAIEKAGMLPPETQIEGNGMIAINEWESENETK